MKRPYVFDEFISSGLEVSVSPFLTRSSRSWGKFLSLKIACLSSLLLIAAFITSFFNQEGSYLLLSLVYFLVGTPALISALKDLRNLEINISVLMTFAAFLAILIDSSLEGALLLVLFDLSHALEDMVSKKTKSALFSLSSLAPKSAYMISKDGSIFEKSVKEIEVGDHLLVKHGEIVPLDGKIISGSTSLDLSHLTGESLPILKKEGDFTPAGGRNLEAAIQIEVTRISRDSTLAKIMHLITEASEAKPKIQSTLDQFGKHYATTIIACMFLFSLTLPLLFNIPFLGLEGSIYRSLAFLIAASPCALIIGAPTAYLSSISACARNGILLKGGITLDSLAKCSIIAFDKTGTLTTGKLTCTEFFTLGKTNTTQEEALAIALSLESHVKHPIAKAITLFAKEMTDLRIELENVKAISGSGIEAIYQNLPVAIGLPSYIAEKYPSKKQEEILTKAKELEQKGHILAALKIDSDAFFFELTDVIREETKIAIRKIIQKNKLTPVMLTGDHHTSAQTIGSSLGIEKIFSNLRPDDKLQQIAEIGKKDALAMVGDGINDAPALARAHVGISMGKVGSQAAIDASDAVLLHDDLAKLPWLFEKALSTQRIVKQNLSLALFVIVFASIPALFGIVPLWAAVILHEGGTVLVGLNSLRLLRN